MSFMEVSDATIKVHRNGALTASQHVVLAMTEDEKGLFFRNGPFGLKNPAVRETWLDTSLLDLDTLEDELKTLKPTILVTAWSCPCLPDAWVHDPDFSIRYVCSVTGSVKPRVPRSWIEEGVVVTNWGTMASTAVAEHAFLMVLALLRSLPLWAECLEKETSMFEMMPWLRTRVLRGKRVGLHGFGAVARELAAIMRPFHADVAAYSHGVPHAMMEEFGVTPCPDLRSLFSRSEIVIECEGLNERSCNSVTEEMLRLLPPDGVFVNVGRGAVVDEEALIKLAAERRIRIGLDVFRHEPLPPDSPLRSQPGILLSPHVAGPTWETYPCCGQEAVRNLQRYLRGETVENRVTLEVYDRAT